jgi:hypothetical protein
VAGVSALATWVFGSIVTMRWLPPTQIYLQAIMSVLAYWPVSRLFFVLRRTLTKAREAL